jgi:hypothetical protein
MRNGSSVKATPGKSDRKFVCLKGTPKVKDGVWRLGLSDERPAFWADVREGSKPLKISRHDIKAASNGAGERGTDERADINCFFVGYDRGHSRTIRTGSQGKAEGRNTVGSEQWAGTERLSFQIWPSSIDKRADQVDRINMIYMMRNKSTQLSRVIL